MTQNPDWVTSLLAETRVAEAEKKRSKERSKKKKAAEKRAAILDTPQVDPAIAREFHDPKWTWEAITLLVSSTHCECCGTRHEAPHPYIFITRSHPRYGTHQTPLDRYRHKVGWQHLPRTLVRAETPVPTCPECFLADLESQPDQLEFDFGDPHSFQSPRTGLFPYQVPTPRHHQETLQ